MPTLLQINVCCATLSTGNIAEAIGIEAQRNGWDSIIAYGRLYHLSKNQTFKIGNTASVIEHYLEHRLFDNDGLASRWATKQLIKKIEEIKPDIIHLHNIHDHYLNYQILFKYFASTDIPIVWTLHDCWNFTGGCKYFDSTDCEKWKSECNKCPQKKILFCEKTQMHYRLMNSLQDKIKTLFFVPVSDWLASLLKESKQAHRPSIVIHNGVDLSVFKPMNTKVTSPYILGVAAVWDERKGLNDFVRLRKMLPQECMIKLVGLTDRQIQELPEGIQGIQRTANREELARLYAEASVFVNPTYSDNFPTTNIEALACGTPVVTYRTGGSPEAVDEQTGIVIKQGDIEGLLQAISTIVAQGKDAYVNNCRNRAEKYFNNKIKYKDYIDLYNMLLAKNTEYQAITPPL